MSVPLAAGVNELAGIFFGPLFKDEQHPLSGPTAHDNESDIAGIIVDLPIDSHSISKCSYDVRSESYTELPSDPCKLFRVVFWYTESVRTVAH